MPGSVPSDSAAARARRVTAGPVEKDPDQALGGGEFDRQPHVRPGIFTGLDGGAGQDQLTGQLVTHRRRARLPEPGLHRIEAAACQVQAGPQERVRRAAIGKRGDQFLGLACLACLQVPAGGSRID